eukprot:m.591408 g.591408  ORF g.591408 m.591408 type:complete len:413 (-) comp22378_c0_seq16:753-1991(-)
MGDTENAIHMLIKAPGILQNKESYRSAIESKHLELTVDEFVNSSLTEYSKQNHIEYKGNVFGKDRSVSIRCDLASRSSGAPCKMYIANPGIVRMKDILSKGLQGLTVTSSIRHIARSVRSRRQQPQTLDLAGIAAYIKSGKCKSVIVLTGAGVSTGAGIPDFRSPGGMYGTLNPSLITATEQERYLEVRRPFILGTAEHRWKATLSHWFLSFLHEEGLLTRLYTQNIDGLDYQTDIPPEKIVPVHGSVGIVKCEHCQHEVPLADFCRDVRANIKDIYGHDASAPAASSPIPCPACNRATLKPNTVLFGSPLPREFFSCAAADTPTADLLIVAGTSLVVQPANQLVQSVQDSCPRLIVNKERVGMDLGIEYDGSVAAGSRDVFAEGEADDTFMELTKLLGWEHKFDRICDRLP